MKLKQYFRSYSWQKKLIISAFVIIPLILLFVFTYLPFCEMVGFSFYDMKYIGKRTFVGLRNYKDVFTATVTSMVLKGVGTYSEYYASNLYLQSPKLRTVAISLYTFTGPMESRYNLICAGVIISLIPALIVFLLCQKQIHFGITAGAVKG